MKMMNFRRETALAWLDKAVSDNPADDPQNYLIACMQRIFMYFSINRGDEIIAENYKIAETLSERSFDVEAEAAKIK